MRKAVAKAGSSGANPPKHPAQGNKTKAHIQAPRGSSNSQRPPRSTEAKNTSITKPGSGTRGTNPGAH